MEVVYTVCDVEQKQSNCVAGIDLGLTNLMAITSNQPGVKPLLVNGRPLKSINQYFNKKLAKAQSLEAWRQIKELNFRRDNRVNNYLHTASRRVINWCVKNEVSTVVIGNNQGMKQNILIGKRNNQQFTKIPHSRLIEMLVYKGYLAGIKVLITEESYTSKASA
nr:transposase [Okeania sp. SIO2C2]